MYKYEDLNFNQIINDSNIDMDSPEALYAIAVSYTHLTLPTNREV